MFSASYGALNSFCLGQKPLSKERTGLKNCNTAFSASLLVLLRIFGVSLIWTLSKYVYFYYAPPWPFLFSFPFLSGFPLQPHNPTPRSHLPTLEHLSLPGSGFRHKEKVNAAVKGDKNHPEPSPAPRPGQAWGAINIFME